MVVGQLALAMRTHWVAVGTNEGKLIEFNWIKFSFQTWKAETVFRSAKITCSVSIKTKKSPTSERTSCFCKWDLKFCQILILPWNCKCDSLQQVHWNSLLPLAKHQKSRGHVSVLIISFPLPSCNGDHRSHDSNFKDVAHQYSSVPWSLGSVLQRPHLKCLNIPDVITS